MVPRIKIEVFLNLSCWLSQLNWNSQQGRARKIMLKKWNSEYFSKIAENFSTVLMAQSAIKMQKYKVPFSFYCLLLLGFITLFTGRCCCRYISSNTQTKDGQRKIAAQLAIVMTSSHLFTKRSITPVLYTVKPYFGTGRLDTVTKKKKYFWPIFKGGFSTFVGKKFLIFFDFFCVKIGYHWVCERERGRGFID